MIKKIALLAILTLLISFTFVNNFRELVIEKLESYANDYPEKVFVQTDKPYYTTGDDIWYTAYLVNGITHRRTDKSRVIYVELINDQDSILSTKQLYTNDISVAGDFKIEKKWGPGNYILRAYTNYMRNNDDDNFFQKEIPIWNISSQDSISAVNDTTKQVLTDQTQNIKPKINFYPESGYLINNISCKIAIKSKDQNGNNISVNGLIKNSNNEIICKFKTQEFGLGVILLKQKPNETYYASMNINGEEFKYPLPNALPNGYNLSITNNSNMIVLKVISNQPVGLKNSFLIGHQRGKAIFEKLETSQTNTYSVKLNIDNLSDGVTNFTLFDGSGKPVCERLIYIENPKNKIKVNVSLDNEAPNTRNRVSMRINLKDLKGTNLSANLSMSITDIDAIQQSTKTENIKTHLLLNSDLRGHIENPGYFFEKENDAKRRYILDLVMLTNGWRRFIWDDLLYNPYKTSEKFPPETGVYIKGRTTALTDTKEPISAATRLTLIGNEMFQEEKQSKLNGIFAYGPYVFNDTVPSLIEARIRDFKTEFTKNRDVNILLDEVENLSPKIIRENIIKSINPDETTFINYIKDSQKISEIDAEFLKDARRLDEVLILAKRRNEVAERTKLLNDNTYHGTPTHRLDLNNIIGGESQSIILLLNSLPGVIANQNGVSIRNGGMPRIQLNGFQVTFEDVLFMSGFEIEFIDVLSGANANFYSNSGNGVIAIYTKTGNFSSQNVKRKPGIIDFKAIGFYTAREFYAPDHDKGFDELLKQDIRTTLHWEPKIVLTPDSTEANVSFFTSDSRSNYAIKIEGITDTGIPFYHLSTFEVD